MCQSEDTRQIFMKFSPLVVVCLLKKAPKGGGGVISIPGPPWLRPCFVSLHAKNGTNLARVNSYL